MLPLPLSSLQDLVSLPDNRDIIHSQDEGPHHHMNDLYKAIPMNQDSLGISTKKAKHQKRHWFRCLDPIHIDWESPEKTMLISVKKHAIK